MSPAPDAPYNEQAILNELVFALGRRDEPTVALVECASLAKRRELEAELAARMPEYQFYQLDVTPYTVTSLLGTLHEHLPDYVRDSQPVSWVINVHGLENSRLLSQDGQLVPSPLTAQLNLERELLFRRVPYLLVLWGDADFFRAVQREAPDFWHWVTYRFRFEDHTARPVAALPPLPPERLPGPGNVAERQARIAELRERYDHLALDDSDKKRLLKDKIDILTLLGAEYKEAFEYAESEEAYRMAIALQERLRGEGEERGKLWYELGSTYLRHTKATEALEAFATSETLLTKDNQPALRFQIGRAYAIQQEWKLALESYQQALDGWHGTPGFYQCLCYFGIGRAYEEQQVWESALQNYHQAITAAKEVENFAEVGQCYFQIGRVYEQQHVWSLAMGNYQTALHWQEEFGSINQGGTYYHLGRVCEAQASIQEAFSWYGMAVEHLTKYGHPFLGRAQEGLTRMLKLL